MLPKDYLATADKKEDTAITKPLLKEESKTGEKTSSQRKKSVVGDPIVLFIKLKRKMCRKIRSRSPYHKPQTTSQKAQYTKHDQDETAVGGRDGKVEYKI